LERGQFSVGRLVDLIAIFFQLIKQLLMSG